MSLDVKRRQAGRRSGRLSTLVLLAPAMLLVVVLFGSIAIFASRSIAPDASGDSAVITSLASGALDGFFWQSMARTVMLSLLAAIISSFIALMVVDALVTLGRPVITAITLVLLFTPLVVSMAVRGYGWLLILDKPLIQEPLRWLGGLLGGIGLTAPALSVVLVLVHSMMPLTALPLLSKVTEIHEMRLSVAAHDLGSRRVRTFFRLTFPLAGPTLLRVMSLTLALSMGAFGIPAIIGRGRVMLVSELVYQNLLAVDWATAFVRLVALLIVAAIIISPMMMIAARWGRRNNAAAGGNRE